MADITPFQYLKQHINKLNFDCPEQYRARYKRVFANVLDRLDKHFQENKLYEAVDFQEIVENLLNSNFKFIIDEKNTKSRGWAGYQQRPTHAADGLIAMSPAYLVGDMKESEGVLCHEFFHFLTTGQRKIHFTEDGRPVEIDMMRGLKIYTDTNGRDPVQGGVFEGGFMCEGLTELSKESIYPEKECYKAYQPQTTFMSFMNTLTGTKVSLQDYFRVHMQNYLIKLGHYPLNNITDRCQKFQAKFNKSAFIDYQTDPDFLAAQDELCTSIINKFGDGYKVEDFIKVCSCIMSEAPSYHGNRKEKYWALIEKNASNFITKTRIPPKLILATIKKQATINAGIFAPFEESRFAFKENSGNLEIFFNDKQYFNVEKIKNSTGFSVLEKDLVVECKKDGEGKHTLSAKKREDGSLIEIDCAKIELNSKHPEQVVVTVGEKTRHFNLASTKQKLQRDVDTNTNLMHNMAQQKNIRSVMAQLPEGTTRRISLISLDNNDKYMVVKTSNNATTFFKVEKNGVEKVDIRSIEKHTKDMKITHKIFTGENETGMVGYLATNKKADAELDQIFTLSNGVAISTYYDKQEAYCQMITPFTDGKPVLLECKNELVYDATNQDLVNMFNPQAKRKQADEQTI